MARIKAKQSLELMLSLIPYVMQRGSVSLKDLSDEFKCDEKTIEDAAKYIATTGVPGDLGKYLHGDLFDIDWDLLDNKKELSFTFIVSLDNPPVLSSKELQLLATGLDYIEHYMPELKEEIYSVKNKFLRVFPESSKMQIAKISSIYTPNDFALQNIRKAIINRQKIVFEYENSSHVKSTREVLPISIKTVSKNWFLKAWCYDRKELRVFSGIKISNLKLNKTINDIEHKKIYSKLDKKSLENFSLVPDNITKYSYCYVNEYAFNVLRDFVPERVQDKEARNVLKAHPIKIKENMKENYFLVKIKLKDWGSITQVAVEYFGDMYVVSPKEVKKSIVKYLKY